MIPESSEFKMVKMTRWGAYRGQRNATLTHLETQSVGIPTCHAP